MKMDKKKLAYLCVGACVTTTCFPAIQVDAAGLSATSLNVGDQNTATGNYVATIGYKNKATGENSIVIGDNSQATGDSSVAMGSEAKALAKNSFALGTKTTANGVSSVAFGNGTSTAAGATGATAFGYETKANAVSATAFGYQTEASGSNSTTFGNNTKASGEQSTAFGSETIADGKNATAFGYKTNAKGEDATAFGIGTIASGTQATAFGLENIASAKSATAFGSNNTASGENSTVFGAENVASGTLSTVFGFQSKATSTQSTAFGNSTEANGVVATAFGNESVANGTYATAFGNWTVANGTASTAFGAGSHAYGKKSTAFGSESRARGENSLAALGGYTGDNALNGVALGWGSKVEKADTYALGTLSTAHGEKGATAIGTSSLAAGDYTTAIGYQAGSQSTATMAPNDGAVRIDTSSLQKSNDSIFIGKNAGRDVLGADNVVIGNYDVADNAPGTNKGTFTGITAVGREAKVLSNKGVAVGYTSSVAANSESAIAIGDQASAKNAPKGIAIGKGAKAEAEDAISIGTGNTVSGAHSGAIGDPTTITGTGTYTIGNNNGIVAANNSGAFGNNNTFTGAINNVRIIGNNNTVTVDDAMILGNKSTVTGVAGVAIGTNAKANNANDVALGANSETTVAVGTPSASINGVTHNFAGIAPNSTVSVGKSGAERTITNVAAGRISATSTDAINGSQLFAVTEEINKGIVYAGDVKAAAAGANEFTQKLGEKTNIVGGVTNEADLTNNNIGVVSNGDDTLTVKLKKDVDLGANGSLKTGATTINNTGFTNGTTAITGTSVTTDKITVGPIIIDKNTGIDAGGKQITNVASGLGTQTLDTADANTLKNAATIADLKKAVGDSSYDWKLSDGTAPATNVADGSTVNIKGSANAAPTTTVGVTTTLNGNDIAVDLSQKAKDDIQKGVDAKTAVDKGTVYAGDVADTGAVQNPFKRELGQQTNVKGGINDTTKLTDNNIGVVSNGTDTLTVKLAKAINLGADGSLTTGATTINNDGFKNGNVKVTNTGLDNGGNVIKNVASGNVNNNDTDNNNAATIGDLKKVVADGAYDWKLSDGTSTATNVADGSTVNIKGSANAAPTTTVGVTTTHNGNDIAVDLSQKAKDDIQKGVDAKTKVDTEGLTFTGDTGTTGAKKLGETVAVTGDANITSTASNTGIAIALKKDLTGLTSAQIGGTTINNGGISTNGLNMNNHQITNVASGGTTGTNAANIDDVNNITNAAVSKGTVYAGDVADTGAAQNSFKRELGQQTNVKGGINDTTKLTDNNIGVVSNGTDTLTVKLAKAVNLGADGSLTTGATTINNDGFKNGNVKVTSTGLDNGGNVIKNVASGNVNNNASDNNNAATIGDLKNAVAAGAYSWKLSDGSATENAITTGSTVKIKGSANAAPTTTVGVTTAISGNDITVDLSQKAKDDIQKGVDAKTATDKGLNFKGDDATVINKKLGDQLDIKGGATSPLTEDNIGVVSDAGALKIKLAQKLKLGADGEISFDTTKINKDGLTVGNTTVAAAGVTTDKVTVGPVVIDKNMGINAGDKQVTNVASGLNGADLATASGNTLKNAVNVGDLQAAVSGAANKGLQFGANSGADVTNKLGSKVTVKGEGTKADADYSGANIKTKVSQDASGNTTIDVMMDKNLNVESVTATDATDPSKKTVTNGAGVTSTDGTNTHTFTATEDKLDNGAGATNTSTATSNTLESPTAKNESTAEGNTITDKATGNNTKTTADGLTVEGNGKTVKVTADGLDNGGNQAKNIASGLNPGETLEQATGDTLKNAANIGDLQKAVAGATTKVADGKNTTVTSDTNPDGSKTYKVNINDNITLGTDPNKQVNVNGDTGTITAGTGDNAVAINGTNGTVKAGKVTIDGAAGTVNGLTNKTWDVKTSVPVSGQAATEDQLKSVSDVVNQNTTNIAKNKDDIAANKAEIEKGLNFTGDDTGTSINKKLGQTLTIKGGADANALSEGNIGVVADNGALSVRLAKDIKGIDSITTNADPAGNKTIVSSNGVTISNGGSNPVTLTSNGLNNGGNKITGVADGIVAPGSKDAVNGGQLHQVASAVEGIGDEVHQVGALGAALSALKPIQYDPLEPTQIMAGIGTYRSSTAVALGLAHYKNESMLLHAGVSYAGGGNNHVMANAGVTWKFGNRSAEGAVPDTYRQGPISSTYALQDEVRALKAENAQIKHDYMDLKQDNERIKSDNDQMRRDNEELKVKLNSILAALGK